MMKKTLLFSLLVPVLMPGLTTMSYAGDKPNEIHIEKHATTNPELEGMSREERRDYWQKKREERLANMTPEQRQAWEEKRRARREKWESMSPEERQAMRDKHRQMREKMKGMSPEERRDYWQKKREERLANMTPEQRQAWEEKRRARREKWESMSPEEREEIRKHWQHKFDEAPAGGSENRK